MPTNCAAASAWRSDEPGRTSWGNLAFRIALARPPNPQEVTGTAGVLVYMNVNGRIRNAVSQVEALGGKVLEPTHAIGPHGFRAIVLDSEGNRIALHSESDR